MLKYLFFVLSFWFLNTSLFAKNSQDYKSGQINRVIYITFDGVRWQNVFLDDSIFAKFWQKHAEKSNIYGKPGSTSYIEVASIPISLPSYQSQMAGSVQPCASDVCGRITVETFPEILVHTLGFKKQEVATFGSDSVIDMAVEHIEGTTFTNIGNIPVYDPDTFVADSVMEKLNAEQLYNQRENSTRFDRLTFLQALHYLEKYKPKFLWIALDESDHFAHLALKNAYEDVLCLYDEMLDILLTKLKELNIDDETMVIVTTDHGRGNGIFWITHGSMFPESKQTWAFVINGKLIPDPADKNHFSTNSIWPTVLGVFTHPY